uniref:E3 ubiquitin-protein ligase APD1-4 middle domain-containing protein n=1 Tax=Scylla olivacea TaxID=85551 RepID=A0A0P4WA79_SCYOL
MMASPRSAAPVPSHHTEPSDSLFYFLSTDGAQLMILRGVNNLHRCAWIGEEDSAEEGEASVGQTDHVVKDATETSPFFDKAISGEEPLLPEEARRGSNEVNLQGDEPDAGIPEAPTSEERQGELEHLLRKAIRMSKNKKEILRLLHMLHRSDDHPLPRHLQRRLGIISEDDEDTLKPQNSRDTADRSYEKMPPPRRLRRETKELPTAVDFDGALEVFDEENGEADRKTHTAGTNQNPAENIIGGQVFFPEGLRVERGKFNQTNKNDGSNEEHVSSYSSSEEALASCEGVIMTLPLAAYRACSFRWTNQNKVVYDIPITGTYYFVFSSDNEIASNNLFFNLTLQRVTYDIKSAVRLCTNATECSLPLSFWSDDQTLVEVPEEKSWSNTYVLDTVCRPRVPLFLAFILAAPLLILLCAFH